MIDDNGSLSAQTLRHYPPYAATCCIENLVNKPLYLEQLQKGDRWISPKKMIDREQVIAFADLTGDHDRLHVDEDFARASNFHRPIAHGLLGLSIMAGLSSNFPSVQTLAFTDLTDWQFKHPIYFGDTVHVETEVVNIEPHGRRAGKVTWFRQLINQDGCVVQQGCLTTIVATAKFHNRERKNKGLHQTV